MKSHNIKLAKSVLIFLLLAVLSCNNQSSPLNNEKTNNSSKLIESFGQVYETLDGQRHIVIISSDEIELQENGENIVCKYTKQGSTLRIITNLLGSSQAIYYQIKPEGIMDDRNQMFYSSAALVDAKNEAQLAEQRAAEQARIDALNQEQERIRIQEMIAQSKVISRIILQSSVTNILTPGSGYSFHEITKTEITDVNVTFSGEHYWFSWSQSEFTIKPYKVTFWYGDITNFELNNEVFPFQGEYLKGSVLYITGPDIRLFFKESEKNIFADKLIQAWESWKTKYSDIMNYTKN